MSLTRLLALLGVLMISVDVEGRERIPVSSLVSRDIKLKCDLPMSDPPQVEWIDFVNNEDHDAEKIFTSNNNPQFRIHRRHPQREKFSVDKDYSLTIKLPTVEKDPGEYVCQSKADDQTYVRSYYLTVGGLPKCDGRDQLLEGQDTSLTCSSAYSGNLPSLKWIKEGTEVESEDQYDIRLARRAFRFKVSRKDDKTKYICRFEMGDIVEECSITLSVQHLVQHLAFDPNNNSFYVKDKVRCVADGNPEPEITLTPKLDTQQAGSGYKLITIPEKWRGTKQVLQCMATNKLDDESQIRVINKTIIIREENPASMENSTILVNNIAIVAGIIVGVILLIIIIVAVICLRLRKARSAQKDNKKPFIKEDGNERDKNGKV